MQAQLDKSLMVVLEEWRMGYNNVIKIEASEGAKRVIDVLTSLAQNGGGCNVQDELLPSRIRERTSYTDVEVAL